VNKSNSISLDEFKVHLDDQRALAYFESIKLDVTEAPMIFNLIDIDKSGSVDIEEFVAGFDRLRGEARALDGAILRLLFENLDHDFRGFAQEVRDQLNDLRKAQGLKPYHRLRSSMGTRAFQRAQSSTSTTQVVETARDVVQSVSPKKAVKISSQEEVIPIKAG